MILAHRSLPPASLPRRWGKARETPESPVSQSGITGERSGQKRTQSCYLVIKPITKLNIQPIKNNHPLNYDQIILLSRLHPCKIS